MFSTPVFGDVTSANVVGYSTQAVAKGKYAAVGVQFTSVGDSNNQITIGDFIKGDFEAYDYSFPPAFAGKAPNIQYWTGGGYTQYYYLKEHYMMNNPNLPFVPEGWCNSNGQAADTDKFDAGAAVWFICPASDCTITTPGQVVMSDEQDFTCSVNKYKMLANFIPTPLDLNNNDQVAYEGIAPYDYSFPPAFAGKAPNIQVWTGGGYTQYYYLKEHYMMNNPNLPFVPEGWCNSNGQALTGADKIPVGRGFWIIVYDNDATKTYKVTFKQ